MKCRHHLERVAGLPCCVCGAQGVQVHHIIGRGVRGLSQKSSDWFGVPLCCHHHSELHRDGWREWEQRHGKSQIQLAAETLHKLYGWKSEGGF